MPSFPRIVLYNDPNRVQRTFSLPKYYVQVKRHEPIILVKQNEGIQDTGYRFGANYFIPIKALLLNQIPLTAITRWAVRFQYLPYLYNHEFMEIEDWVKNKNMVKNPESVPFTSIPRPLAFNYTING